MAKIKLKPNLQDVEVGIGNKVNLKVAAGETVEVAEDLLGPLLSFGHFEEVHEADPLGADPSGADPSGDED